MEYNKNLYFILCTFKIDLFQTLAGLIASICLPVSYQGDLKGVLCIDQTFGELLSELTYFQVGESSYSFMVDEHTRVLEHPNVENPTFVTNTPRFTYLKTLETGDNIDVMIDSIQRSGSFYT